MYIRAMTHTCVQCGTARASLRDRLSEALAHDRERVMHAKHIETLLEELGPTVDRPGISSAVWRTLHARMAAAVRSAIALDATELCGGCLLKTHPGMCGDCRESAEGSPQSRGSASAAATASTNFPSGNPTPGSV